MSINVNADIQKAIKDAETNGTDATKAVIPEPVTDYYYQNR